MVDTFFSDSVENSAGRKWSCVKPDEGKGLTYYGVAVVPASACAANPEITLGDLKGLRSCHTGYKRTSGWTIPLANVVDLEQQAQGPEYIKDKND